jgi:molybdenum cofactor guanylyltransferase
MKRGAIILCGGRSSRMGVDKAFLPFGHETMLERVVRIISSVVVSPHIAVVAAADQQLPQLEVIIARDLVEYQGPLTGIARGCESLPPAVEAFFVSGCDTPLLSSAVIRFLFETIGNFECIVPQDEDGIYPLCAVYRSDALRGIMDFEDQSLRRFIARLRTHYVPYDELRAMDPDLNSFRNVNTHADYLAALAVAGVSTP